MIFGIGVHKFDQVLHLFGRPTTITAFMRSLRPAAPNSYCEIEDSYDIILRYDPNGPHAKLITTIKTNAVTKKNKPLAYFIKGYNGSFIKFGDDPQEVQISSGMKRTDKAFGWEDESIWGTLETTEKVMEGQVKEGDMWVGKVKSEHGDYAYYYEDVVKAVRGGEVVIKPQTSRDGIRLSELARDSARSGRTVQWS
jgi:predicted dehydrogenase